MEHKGGTRGGRLKVVEDNIIEKLATVGSCTVYANSKRFSIEDLIADLESQLKTEVRFEEIKTPQKAYSKTLKCLVTENKTIGYKLFLK